MGEAVQFLHNQQQRDHDNYASEIRDLRRDDTELLPRLENTLLRAGIGIAPTLPLMPVPPTDSAAE